MRVTNLDPARCRAPRRRAGAKGRRQDGGRRSRRVPQGASRQRSTTPSPRTRGPTRSTSRQWPTSSRPTATADGEHRPPLLARPHCGLAAVGRRAGRSPRLRSTRRTPRTSPPTPRRSVRPARRARQRARSRPGVVHQQATWSRATPRSATSPGGTACSSMRSPGLGAEGEPTPESLAAIADFVTGQRGEDRSTTRRSSARPSPRRSPARQARASPCSTRSRALPRRRRRAPTTSRSCGPTWPPSRQVSRARDRAAHRAGRRRDRLWRAARSSKPTCVVERGEVVAVVGANGSGKTTLVKGVLGLAELLGGSLRLFGQPADQFARALPPRLRTAAPDARRSADGDGHRGRDHGAVGPQAPLPAARQGRSRAPCCEAIGRRRPGRSSQWRLQRAERRPAAPHPASPERLASEAEVLVLDEPLAGVDHDSAVDLADTLGELVAGGVTVVTVLHELGPLAPLITRVVWLDHGRRASTTGRPSPCARTFTGHGPGPHGGEPAAPGLRLRAVARPIRCSSSTTSFMQRALRRRGPRRDHRAGRRCLPRAAAPDA